VSRTKNVLLEKELARNPTDGCLLDFSPWELLGMKETLLLIDDNAVQAVTRQTILRRAGYLVISVLSPARVLEQLQNDNFPAEVQLVITDHLMPGMSGAAFVRELRKLRPSLPVMVISGMEDAECEYEGLDVLFRVKPLQPDNLLDSVHRLVAHNGSQPMAQSA